MSAVLEVNAVSKRFGGLLALNQVTIAVGSGEIVGLIGPNGSGKTTLFNVVTGLYRPDHGRVTFEGRVINGLPPHVITRRGIGRTFQIVRPFHSLSTTDNVAAAYVYGREGKSAGSARTAARALLVELGLGHAVDAPIGRLTLAEKKRLEVARALATSPRLLLLDEVFAGLNPAEVDRAIDLFATLRRQRQVTILIVEHVMKAVMRLCDRVVVLSYGEVIAAGAPRDVAADPGVRRVYLGEGFGAGA